MYDDVFFLKSFLGISDESSHSYVVHNKTDSHYSQILSNTCKLSFLCCRSILLVLYASKTKHSYSAVTQVYSQSCCRTRFLIFTRGGCACTYFIAFTLLYMYSRMWSNQWAISNMSHIDLHLHFDGLEIKKTTNPSLTCLGDTEWGIYFSISYKPALARKQ